MKPPRRPANDVEDLRPLTSSTEREIEPCPASRGGAGRELTLESLLLGMIRDAVQRELREGPTSKNAVHVLSSVGHGSSCVHAPMTTAQAARYCGFKTTAAIRKALREGRLAPLGRRGGTGTYMWSRHALDAFLAGARNGIVPLGRPGAPPSNAGGHHGKRRQLDHEMEVLNSADTLEAGGLAQEGGRLSGARPRRGPPNRKAARGPESSRG